MSITPSPFLDHAAPILSAEPSINDDQRAELWDAFYSKNADELAQHLAPLAIPDDTKHKLFQAKQLSMPAPAPLDKAAAAIKAVANIDPKVLDIAETHPNVLKVLSTAATTEPKPSAGDSGTSSEAGKGKTASAAPKPVLKPRIDGQPHLPAIPDKHHRVLASNGGIYDVPAENISKAQELDPNLHILNP